MKKFLLLFLLFASGCCTAGGVCIRENEIDLLEKHTRRIISEHEQLILQKKEFQKTELAKYYLSVSRNSALLAEIGALRRLKGDKLKNFIEKNRQIKKVNEYLEKFISEKDK